MINKHSILFDKYLVLDQLGSGSFSSVLLVRHLSMELERAIKIIPKTQIGSVSDIMEAKFLKTLNHPGIPKIYDIEEDEENFYLVEEYIQGESLNEFLLHQPVISQKLFFKFCEQLCDIFKYLHSFSPSPILYRDLKPEHIIVCGIQIKLIDFGISTYLTSLGNNCNRLGNVDFSAPESFTNDEISLQADIYSIGQIMNYLSKHLKNKPSWSINQIIHKATAEDTASRFETVAELDSAIKKIIEKDNQPQLRNSIAIVGANSGCGSTHIAVSLVSTLNYLGYSSVYFEKNSSNNLQNAAKYQNYFVEQNGFFYYKFFCGMPNYGPGVSISALKTSEIISVWDFGNNYTENQWDQFDMIILVCNGSIWHFHDSFKAVASFDKLDIPVTVICNMCDKHQSMALAKLIQRAVYNFSYDSNPFLITNDKKNLFLQLLSKKGWFLSFSKKRKRKFKFLKQL